MRKLLPLLLCIMCNAQKATSVVAEMERIKVTGKSNPLTASDVQLVTRTPAYGGGLGIAGKMWNAGSDDLYEIVIRSTVKRTDGPPISAQVELSWVGARDFNYFDAPLPGLADVEKAESISFELISSSTRVEIAIRKERERDAEFAALEARKQKALAKARPECV